MEMDNLKTKYSNKLIYPTVSVFIKNNEPQLQ
jgi:hypothetical protein